MFQATRTSTRRISASISDRTTRLSARSAGRRANGRIFRPLGSSSGEAGSCGNFTICIRIAQDGRALPITFAGVSTDSRNDSRITRRIRLRTGEDGASFLGIAIISRGSAGSLATRTVMTKCSPAIRKGRLEGVTPGFKHPDACDLWHDAHESPHAHRGSSSARESRACACAGPLKVDMCVS